VSVKDIIKSQYLASLEMLRQAIQKCPDPLWADPEYKNQSWHIAYHALFYTHLYLHPTEDDFTPMEMHRENYRSLDPYTKGEILGFLQYCTEQVGEMVEALDLEAESGFYWLPFSKLELQFYNIRHIMEHTGELGERIGAKGELELKWVGMKASDD